MNRQRNSNVSTREANITCLIFTLIVFSIGFAIIYFSVTVPANERAATERAKPTQKPTPSFEITKLYDFCAEGGFPMPTKKEFDGSDLTKKHLVTVLNQITLQNSFTGKYNFFTTSEGKEWIGNKGTEYVFQTPGGFEYSDIELVLCEAFVQKSTASNTCNYEGGHTQKLFGGTWDLTLYDSKTGKLINSGRILSNSENCSAGITTSNNQPAGTVEIISPPDQARIETWFKDIGM